MDNMKVNKILELIRVLEGWLIIRLIYRISSVYIFVIINLKIRKIMLFVKVVI